MALEIVVDRGLGRVTYRERGASEQRGVMKLHNRVVVMTLTLEEVEGLYDTLGTSGHQYRYLRPVQRALLDQIATILQTHPESTVIDTDELEWLRALKVCEEGESDG